MLVLLPPSETKRDGGDPATVLDLDALAFPALRAQRRIALSELRALSRTLAGATHALRLGESQRFEIERNRVISTSPTLPAIDRYTGVLYDGLDAASLNGEARRFLERNVAIHSALFGLSLGGDAIPAYRLSHDSRMPKTRLKALWRDAIAAALDATPGLLLDLRSEAYVELGPAPTRPDSAFLRVLTEAPDGTRRALNHFNKKGKGEFVRALAESAAEIEAMETIDALVTWAAKRGIRLFRGAPGELELVVDGVVGASLAQPLT